jgi:glycosyltransferase involved in cell wall biosynthesis
MTPPPSTNPEPTEEVLYVLIPCLNEEGSIRLAAEEVLGHAPNLPMSLRVLMIDDGSNDDTRGQMEAICSEHSECDMIVNPRNLGLGRSVMGAYDRIPDRAWVTVLPGDNELMFAASIDNFVRIRDRYDVILGYLQNPVVRPLGRRLASFAYSKVTSTLYGFRWTYINGLKMYRVDAFRGIEVLSGGHAFVAELLAKAQLRQPSLRIGEAPFVARGRAHGQSQAIRPRSIARAVREVYQGARAVSSYRDAAVRGDDADD